MPSLRPRCASVDINHHRLPPTNRLPRYLLHPWMPRYLLSSCPQHTHTHSLSPPAPNTHTHTLSPPATNHLSPLSTYRLRVPTATHSHLPLHGEHIYKQPLSSSPPSPNTLPATHHLPTAELPTNNLFPPRPRYTPKIPMLTPPQVQHPDLLRPRPPPAHQPAPHAHGPRLRPRARALRDQPRPGRPLAPGPLPQPVLPRPADRRCPALARRAPRPRRLLLHHVQPGHQRQHAVQPTLLRPGRVLVPPVRAQLPRRVRRPPRPAHQGLRPGQARPPPAYHLARLPRPEGPRARHRPPHPSHHPPPRLPPGAAPVLGRPPGRAAHHAQVPPLLPSPRQPSPAATNAPQSTSA